MLKILLEILTGTLKAQSVRFYLATQHLLPDLDQVVTATRCKSFDVVWLLTRRLFYKAPWYNSRSPANCITSNLVNEKHYC